MLLDLQIIVILFIISTNTVHSNNCYKPEISLIQKIEHEGFHREFRWILEHIRDQQWSENRCKLALRLDIPHEMYLDPDQINEYNRQRKLSVFIDGDVDVEAVAHLAPPHIAYIYLADSGNISLSLPFHLRYQRAQISGGTGKILINRPSVLVDCPNVCSKLTIEAPCDLTGTRDCLWKNVTYQALFDEMELLVPVGNLDDYPLVSIVTLLLGCAGCIYVLSVLSTVPL